MSRITKAVALPTAVGVAALLLGAMFAWLTFRGDATAEAPARSASHSVAAPSVSSRPFVFRAGGFALQVPRDLDVSRRGRTATFTSGDRNLVVTVGPGASGALREAAVDLLDGMQQEYERVTLVTTEHQVVDDRPALALFGRATNRDGVGLRYLAVLVQAKPRNYVVTAYTSADSDPRRVLPRVDAMVRSFEVL